MLHEQDTAVADDLAAEVARREWYHRIELPGGITTPGWSPNCAEAYRIPEDLTGKRVLDVGAWDGHWTFEALKRGARQVVAIDDMSDPADYQRAQETAPGAARKGWDNFDLCAAALGYGPERCERRTMSLYHAEPLGHFDICFFFGVLYHCRYPLLALDILSRITTEAIYVESAVLDDFSPYRGGLGKGYGHDMVMEFYPGVQYAAMPTNWWSPTLQLLGQMVLSAGFARIHAWKLVSIPTAPYLCRGFVKGEK